MTEDKPAAAADKPMGEVIQIDQQLVRKHLDEVVRSTVEQTLNADLPPLTGVISERVRDG